MELKDFQSQAEKLIEQFQELIEKLPQKGDKSEDCQRVCLQIHLSELEATVTGTVASDLLECTCYCSSCCWEGMEEELKTNTDLSGDSEVGYNKCCPECRSEDIEKI